MRHPHYHAINLIANSKKIQIERFEEGNWIPIGYEPNWDEEDRYRIRHINHIHRDVMLAWANDCTIDVQAFHGGKWVSVPNPTFNTAFGYRINPEV